MDARFWAAVGMALCVGEAGAEQVQITDTPNHAEWLCDIDENIIVFDRAESDGQGGYCYAEQRVFGYDLDTGTEFPVGAQLGRQREPKIDQPYVVWSEHRGNGWDVYGINLETQAEFLIAGGPGHQEKPDIDGSWVVYRDEVGDVVSVYAVNLTTWERREVCLDCGSMSSIIGAKGYHGPSLSGDVVVWQDSRFGINPEIWGWRFSTGEQFPICTDPARQEHPQVCGSVVTWMDRRLGATLMTIYARDLETGEEWPVAYTGGEQRWQDVSDRFVVWREGSVAPRAIWTHDLQTGTLVAYAEDDSLYQTEPAVQGDTICYRGKVVATGGEYDIYATRLPHLARLESCLSHGQSETYCLELGEAPDGAEPRLPGIQELVVTQDTPVEGDVEVQIRTEAGEVLDGVSAVAGPGPEQMTVQIDGGLPNGECFRLVVAGILEERRLLGLQADTDGNGLVNSVDYAGVKVRYGQPADDDTFGVDLDTDGIVTSLDGAAVKARFGETAPDCP